MNFLLGVGIGLIAAVAVSILFLYLCIQKSNIMFEDFCPETSYNENVQEEIQATALVTFQEQTGMDGAAFDLSAYEDKGLIAVTTLYRDNAPGPLTACKDEAGNANVIAFPNQTFGIMKDGGIVWKNMLL